MSLVTFARRLFTDSISESGNAIASVRPSVRPSVYFIPYMYLLNRLAFDLDLLYVSMS